MAALDFPFYCEYVHRGAYFHGRHTHLVCEVLEKVEQGEVDRLMVFMPPRHSKSMTISETFPSWFIGRKPDRKVILASYGDSLARRFGRANRKKVEEFAPSVFGVQLSPEHGSASNWGIEEHGGQMISAGIGGPISGEGADLLVIDDPIKNRQEADSETYRDMVWNEWQNTLLTRLQPGAAVVVILTRWHEDDLAGRLLNSEPDLWTVLSLPAVAEENDALGREPGQALWPEFGFDEDWAAGRKTSVGSYTWSSLYQQRPSPPQGGVLQRGWWQYYRQAPSKFDEVVQSWDMNFKDKKGSSYVVGQVWGRNGADKYLLDQVRARLDFVATLRAVVSLSAKWPQARRKLVEDKANGPAVISSLKRQVSGLTAVTPQGSKEARAHAVSPDIEAGNVYIPDPSIAPWVHDFVEECANFPNSANDDQVDAMSQALDRFQSSKIMSIW